MTINQIPFGVPVTVRVKGQSKRLSRVMLLPVAGDETKVLVRTGRRGRPPFLSLDKISDIKVLATA